MVPPPTRSDAYNQAFYDDQAPGSLSSAARILPIVLDLLRPSSVVDVGCGVGTWLAEAKKLGVGRVFGVDGHDEPTDSLLIDAREFERVDLSSTSLTIDGSFDLALCLEVAEHLEEEPAARLVHLLCSISDVVVFSAAIPGQLGTGHITLHPQSYWIDRFDEEDYQVFDFVRPVVWNDGTVDAWYRQNVLVFVHRACVEHIEGARRLESGAGPIPDIVHPDLLNYWVRRATRPVSTAGAATLLVVAARRAMFAQASSRTRAHRTPQFWSTLELTRLSTTERVRTPGTVSEQGYRLDTVVVSEFLSSRGSSG